MFEKLIQFVLMIMVTASTLLAEGTLIRDRFYSPVMEGERAVNVYLPEEYDTNDVTLRFPVIYFLHGGFADHNDYPELEAVAEDMMENGSVHPFILVKPNGGPISSYANSYSYGPVEDFIVTDLINYIDSSYYTISERDKRCLMGHSMGGNGFRIMFKYPELYRAAAAHGGNIHLRAFVDIMIPSIVIENSGSFQLDPNNGDWTAALFRSAKAFSPNPNNPPHYCDIPINRRGVYNETVWASWLENDAAWQAANFNSDYKVSIYFDAGTQDIWYPVSEAFKETLDTLDIPFVFDSYEGGHMAQLPERYPFAFNFLDSVMWSNESQIENSEMTSIPVNYQLYQNFPNPFNPATTIHYQLASGTDVNITVYDMLGKQVKTLINDIQTSGEFQVVWDGGSDAGKPVSAGIYFYRMQVENSAQTRRMVLLK